ATDRGAVEHAAVLEQLGRADAGRVGDVVLLAEDVGEAQVDEFDVMVANQLLDVLDGHGRWLRAGVGNLGPGAMAVPSPLFVLYQYVGALAVAGDAPHRCIHGT